jgi:hypothetical protein
MAELGLVPGRAGVSSVRPDDERILIVRPVPPTVENAAAEAEISSMGDVETWQKRYERITGDGVTNPQAIVKLLENPYVENSVENKLILTNRGKGPGEWVDPRPRKNNKYSWRKGLPKKHPKVIEAPPTTEEEETCPPSSCELPKDTFKQGS